MTCNPPIRIYVNQIESKFIFRIKTGYYLEMLTAETMTLPGSTKNKITQDENGVNLPRAEITEIHCNIVNDDYQQDLRVLYTFVSNKLFGQLLDVSPKHFIFLKTFESEFSYIEVCFTDQNSIPLEI